jgi:hypothetical protein
VCQELLQLSRLVVILDGEIYRNDLHIIANQYHWKESWSPGENIPYQRSVAWLLVMIVPDAYRGEDLDTICPLLVLHSSELEFMSSQSLKRTYALYAPAGE